MNQGASGMKYPTTVDRASDRELVATRLFDAPPRILFEAWTRPELFMRWWAPKSMGMSLLSCDMDVRTGGSYRLEFGHGADQSWAFFGKYIEVIQGERLVWTNEEAEDGAVSTVTFEEKDGKTLLTYRELYPSKEALEADLGGMDALPEQFEQLDEILAGMGASAGGA